MYAGYGQAEGGGTETIWAHRSFMKAELHDGVIVSSYCCNPELRKLNDKSVLAGIVAGGMLVLHIDYDPVFSNSPNKTKDSSNTHPRCAIVNADNDETIDYQDYNNWLLSTYRGCRTIKPTA